MQQHLAYGFNNTKAVVIPNGVDSKKFFPMAKEDARQQVGLPSESKIVVSVGHLTPNKGFDLLIKAMKELTEKPQDRPLLLVIVGGGAYVKILEALIGSLQLQSSVQLVGAVPHDQLLWYYNAADLVCLMSEKEGWPNVILEALSCGRPMLASRAGGIPEILTSPNVGHVIERSVSQLVESMEQALQQDWNVPEIVAHAKMFDWTQTAQSVETVLRSVVPQQKVEYSHR